MSFIGADPALVRSVEKGWIDQVYSIGAEESELLVFVVGNVWIPAAVARLTKLGATLVERLERWVVMQAPTGQRFCVVRIQS